VKNTKAFEQMPRVVIVGVDVAERRPLRRLRNSAVRVTVIDRTNHSIFSSVALPGCERRGVIRLRLGDLVDGKPHQ
jgi:NADH dehydrogenase FAD-containing subunit